MIWGASRRRKAAEVSLNVSDCNQVYPVETTKLQRLARRDWSRFFLRLRSSKVRSLLLSYKVFIVICVGCTIRFAFISQRIIDSRVPQLKSQYPRYVRYIINERTSSASLERLSLKREYSKVKRRLNVTGRISKIQHSNIRPFETSDCRAQYAWQLASYPTCNNVFDFDLTDETIRFVANGYWRDVWIVKDPRTGDDQVLKTIRYKHEFSPRNYDRHRRDATAMERLTKSDYVMDIYAFCGNSGMFEFGSGGTIMDKIWPPHRNVTAPLNRLDKLRIAAQAAMGVAAVHNIDMEGEASIAHTDISPAQFINVDGTYKLNDFNRARFLRWSRSKNKTCGYHVGKNPGLNRSPEEYQHLEQTEKVDIYSLGNIFYMLLQEEWPFQDLSENEGQKQIIDGVRPSFYEAVWNSEDSIDKALKEAMIMCHQQNATDRASAREVEFFLKSKLMEFGAVAHKRSKVS